MVFAVPDAEFCWCETFAPPIAQIVQENHMPMLEQTAKLVTAYLAKNPVAIDDIPGLIRTTYAALAGLSSPGLQQAAPERRQPAVPVKKSITPDGIHCLECGKKFAMLKRHLHTDHGITPDEYRAKWELAADYPMVAPAYAEVRSTLAKAIGLGRKKAVEQPAAAAAVEPAVTGGRKKLGLFKKA